MRKTISFIALLLIIPVVCASAQTNNTQTTDTKTSDIDRLLAELRKEREQRYDTFNTKISQALEEDEARERNTIGSLGATLTMAQPLSRPGSIDAAVAHVGEHTLSYREVQESYDRHLLEKPLDLERILNLQADYERRLKTPVKGETLSREELEAELQFTKGRKIVYENNVKLKVAGDWVDRQLLLDYARLGRVIVTPQEVQQEARKLRETTFLQEDFDTFLKNQGITYEAFLQELGEDLMIDKMLAKAVENQFPKDALKKLYKEGTKYNKKAFEQPEMAFVIMLFKTNKDPLGAMLPSPELKVLEEQLNTWRKEVDSVRGFADLAREHSDAPYDGDNCVLGWISKGAEPIQQDTRRMIAGNMMVGSALQELSLVYRQLNRFYFKQKVGKVSDVLETKAGYHLVLVTGHQPQMGHNSKSAREVIAERLKEDIRLAILLQERERRWEEVMVDFRGVNSAAAQADRDKLNDQRKRLIDAATRQSMINRQNLIRRDR